MKVLLAGATGFLGYRTLEKLIEVPEVHSIIATGRQIKETHFINHPKVVYVLGDLSDFEFTNSLFIGVNMVINAAALSSPWGEYWLFEKANIQTQRNLIDVATNCGVNRFIYISTPSLYFEMKDKFGIKESDPLPRKFINAYAETKRKAEILLESSKIPYLILRPRALIGRGDTVIMPRLIRAFRESKLKIIGSGENSVDLTSVANVVDAILLGLKANQSALNNTYNISNGEPIKLWTAIELVLNKMGEKLPKRKIPFPIVKMAAQFMEFKSKLTNGNEPAITTYSVGVLAKSFTMDISKARQLLGYEPKVSTMQALDEFVNWYIEHEKG